MRVNRILAALLLMMAGLQTTWAQQAMQVWNNGKFDLYFISKVDSVRFINLVTDIYLSEYAMTMEIGDTKMLTASVYPIDADDQTVTWESSNPDVATVDQTGWVKAEMGGSCIITASAIDGSGVKAECQVTVLDYPNFVDGHEYVEIGGLKWATMNVGATTVAGSYETSFGDYFAWGETEPRYTSMTRASASSASFTWKNEGGYIYDSDYPAYTGNILDVTHDAAAVNWSERWRTPSRSDFQALVEACSGNSSGGQTPVKLNDRVTSGGIYWLDNTQEYEPDYTGVTGILFVSQSDISKRVFFPASGFVQGTTLSVSGIRGFYWSSSHTPSATNDIAYNILFYSMSISPSNSANYYLGYTVRPVVNEIPIPKFVTEIILSETSLILEEDGTADLTAEVLPENADSREVIWESSGKSVAEVDQNGHVAAKGVGSCVITCRATDEGGVYAECQVTVNRKPVPVTEITLDETSITLSVGRSMLLSAYVLPDNADNKELVWESSDNEVAEVSGKGRVKANGTGTCVITCSATDGSGVSTQCTVTVFQYVTDIELSEPLLTLYVNETADLSATVLPENASNKEVVWESNKTSIATVDQTGHVEGISNGTCTITCRATDGSGVKAECAVTVIQLVESIIMSEPSLTLEVEDTWTLDVDVLPENANNRKVVWESSNTFVAEVNAGRVTAVGIGTCVITCRAVDGSGVKAECQVTVNKKTRPVREIVLNATSLTLSIDDIWVLEAVVLPEDADNRTVVWESSNNEVAEVDGGRVTAIDAGICTITCRSTDGSGVYAECVVTVGGRTPVSEIVLSETTLILDVDETWVFEYEVLPNDAYNKAVTWESSDTNVATVDQTGRVTAVARGICVITCHSTDGSGVKAECELTVGRVKPVTQIILNETSLTLYVDETATLSATVLPEVADNREVTWESSRTDVATVDHTGKVTANGSGTCVITCRAMDGSGVKAECIVTVIQLVERITLSQTSLTLYVDETVTLSATVLPADADNKKVTWESSNTNVAAVSQTGRVTGNGSGSCVITCRALDGSSVYAECVVSVIRLVSGITLSETSLLLSPGDSETLTATVVPSDATNKNITWRSSDTGVATIDQTGHVTAISNGSCTITATAADGSGVKAQCAVTVFQYVTDIIMDETWHSLVEGNTLDIRASVLPDNADNKTVTWESSNESVATVSVGSAATIGHVTAVGTGTCVITCRAMDGSGVRGTCTLTVTSSRTIGGHEYVEIGGLKWATMNLGASTVAGSYSSCYGDYYAWGETEPRYRSISRRSPSSATFRWKTDYDGYSDYPSYTGATLDAAHDAAVANWGYTWRTPTGSDFEALAEACTGSSSSQTPDELTDRVTSGGIYWLSAEQEYEPTYTGVAGLLFVSQSDISKRVFFPASGNIDDTALYSGGTKGYYWSSKLNTWNDYGAYSLIFSVSNINPSGTGSRYCGFTVRPVSE